MIHNDPRPIRGLEPVGPQSFPAELAGHNLRDICKIAGTGYSSNNSCETLKEWNLTT